MPITLHACGFPPGITVAAVAQHYRRMGWRVTFNGLRLVAVPLH